MISISKEIIYIKDYKELLNISDTEIIILFSCYHIIIKGINMKLYYYDRYEIRCHGEIHEILFRV